jgi:deoxyadenosine/deoxycytidine kinase
MEDEGFVISYTSVQGVIGAGKSTIMKEFSHYIKENGLSIIDYKKGDDFKSDYFLMIAEPLDEWVKPIHSINKKGENVEKYYSMLELFYKNPEKYGFLFQVNAFTSRLKRIVDTLNEVKLDLLEKNATSTFPPIRLHIIAERSLRTDYLFFQNLYESGKIPEIEWTTYQNFFTLICEELVKKENVVIYVNTSPEKCYQRVQERHRKEEVAVEDENCADKDDCGISFDYLKSLTIKHDEMMQELRKDSKNVTIFDVDFDKQMKQDEIRHITNQLMEKLTLHVKGLGLSSSSPLSDSYSYHYYDETTGMVQKRTRENGDKEEEEERPRKKQRYEDVMKNYVLNNEEDDNNCQYQPILIL